MRTLFYSLPLLLLFACEETETSVESNFMLSGKLTETFENTPKAGWAVELHVRPPIRNGFITPSFWPLAVDTTDAAGNYHLEVQISEELLREHEWSFGFAVHDPLANILGNMSLRFKAPDDRPYLQLDPNQRFLELTPDLIENTTGPIIRDNHIYTGEKSVLTARFQRQRPIFTGKLEVRHTVRDPAFTAPYNNQAPGYGYSDIQYDLGDIHHRNFSIPVGRPVELTTIFYTYQQQVGATDTLIIREMVQANSTDTTYATVQTY